MLRGRQIPYFRPFPTLREPCNMLYASLKLIHLLSIVVWVGGMVFAHFFLRPATQALEPAVRVRLMHDVLERFFAAVLVAVVLMLASGRQSAGRHPHLGGHQPRSGRAHGGGGTADVISPLTGPLASPATCPVPARLPHAALPAKAAPCRLSAMADTTASHAPACPGPQFEKNAVIHPHQETPCHFR